MAVIWTEDQLKAIEAKGNIIVSAGAGSGKTAVLSERVLQHILKDHYNIDELLVLTFTNAAADSMKNKIRKTIQKSPDLTAEQKTKQLNKLDGSYIMTFDAYALSLVKKYHYLLNCDKDINIIDNGILQLKTAEILEEILEENYQHPAEGFTKLLSDFCVRSDDVICEMVIELNNKLNAIYNRDEFVAGYDENYFSDEALDDLFEQYTNAILSKLKTIDSHLNQLSQMNVDVGKVYGKALEFVRCDNYSGLHQYKDGFKYGRIDKGADEGASDFNTKIKAEIKEVLAMVQYSKEEYLQQVKDTQIYCDTLLGLAQELNQRLMAYKKENNLFEFTDVFKMAIDIVDQNEDIRLEIKNYFKEILIDEYQDTNDLQEEFIARIENDNVYMVGDIKQSIYRFRNANPAIFKQKYDDYKAHKGGQAIDLLKNFRSRKEVLEDINVIFDRLMDGKIGGADYNPGHRMVHGNTSYDEEGASQQDHHLEFLAYPYNPRSKEYPFTELSQSEAEAFVIAKDIEEKVRSGYLVYVENPETKQMEKRPCQYRDFCILLDRSTSFEQYKQILTYKAIPLEIAQEEKMNDSDLMAVIKSLFKLVNCAAGNNYGYDFKFSFASAARSFICEMSDEQLFAINRDNDFVKSEIMQKIYKISQGVENKTLNQIYLELVKEFAIDEKLRKIGDVYNNQVKMSYLNSLMHNLNQMNYTLDAFVEYLDEVYDGEEKDLTFNMSRADINAVKIMTIHKSKGLEFTICYFPGLSKRFNDTDKKSSFSFNKNLGITIPAFVENYGLQDTIKKEVNKYGFDNDDVAEKIRLFYVALTRTREKMIAVGPLEDKSVDDPVIADEVRLKMNSFIKMLNPLYSELNNKNGMHIVNILDENDEMGSYGFSKNYRSNKKDVFALIEPNEEEIEIRQLDRIEPVNLYAARFSKNAGLIEKETQDVMDFGTRMHYYLETLDFENPDFSLIPAKYQQKLKAFLASDIMSKAASGKSYREYEFMYLDEDYNERHGFIDLLMEYEDHFDIIDYKLKHIDDENYDKQLNGYRQYLKKLTFKKINCYLYSIYDGVYREVLDGEGDLIEEVSLDED